ncbi:MAG: peptidoglycan DD-metalloendopeptidase family protein [Candidatus Aminicenantes bacterium]|nr:peptidoglycan DD-metalloendopeptidase family protein [Candidatus Aminicenantes bacterium]
MKNFFTIILLCCVALAVANENKLKEINDRIQEIKQKLEELKKEKGSILNEIYEIELRFEKEKIEGNKIDLQLRRTRQKISNMEQRKKKLEWDIEKSKDDIKKMIRILYKLGTNAYLKIFTKINNLDQLFKNYQYLVILINYNMTAINLVKQKILKVEALKNDLKVEYSNVLNLKKIKNSKLLRMKSIKAEKIQLISAINQDKSNHLRLLDELKYDAERLNQLLYKRGTKEELRIIDVDRLKGKLIWPVDGKIISFFGRKKSTRFDTYVFNNGIKIRPSISDEVKAIYFGEVIYADYFMGGYGNLMIIEHAKNFHSLYGHCEKFLKKPGDKVKEGEIIALVGDTGSIYGKSLHFEIRKDLKSQDPLNWFLSIRTK